MRRFARWSCFALGLVIGGGACTDDPLLCTLIGCSDRVFIQIDGVVSTQITIEVVVDGAITAQTICGTTQGECLLILEDFAPAEFTVRVIGMEATVEETFAPTYTEQQPNGPDCPPICLHAHIDMTAAV